MRDKKEFKEERSKQGQTNKQGKATHNTPKAVTFPKKNERPQVGLEPMILYEEIKFCALNWKKVCAD